MPIKIPNNLPAANILSGENIFVMDEARAYSQDIRPLKILLLNLMPTKIVTETQLLRLLGNSPLQVEIDFIYTASYEPKNIAQEHLIKFYETFDDVKHRNYDGLIITGAPIEQLPFEEVAYWEELCAIMEWSKKTCLLDPAHLLGRPGGPILPLRRTQVRPAPENVRRISPHYKHPPGEAFPRVRRHFLRSPFRHTDVKRQDIEKIPELIILSESESAGVYAVANPSHRQIFIMGHSEYDPLTLKSEYDRDVALNLPINVPLNYYPNDDPAKTPVVRWRSAANLLFSTG